MVFARCRHRFTEEPKLCDLEIGNTGENFKMMRPKELRVKGGVSSCFVDEKPLPSDIHPSLLRLFGRFKTMKRFLPLFTLMLLLPVLSTPARPASTVASVSGPLADYAGMFTAAPTATPPL